ncbi:MAG: glycosyltransferase family 39 protein, partial [marine benthic group bacterium]|nr:glycosyltransferase family 39 protein [Gemmatimonadota bacterium]
MSDRPTGSWHWLLALGLALAVLLRAVGLSTEVWMDEILSVRLVETLRSPLGVFTDIHSDNNHYLNSLWLWVVGPSAPAWMMRLPTLVLGATLVVLAYRVTRSRGRTEATVTAALFAVSYPLIHYSSEARGYGYLVFFTLAAYGAFRRWIAGGGMRAGAIYAVSAALAFLAHLGFATVFVALVLWSVLEVIDSRENRARVAWSHAGVHLLPAVTLLVLYFIDIRYMSAAGWRRLKIPDVESYYGKTYPPEFYPESMRAPLVEGLDRAKAGEISRVEAPVHDTEGNEVWYDTTFVPAL